MSKRTRPAPTIGPEGMIKLGRQYIGARIVREAVNLEARTIELAFSSEEPVERWWGTEILGHAPGEANLDWLSSGRAPYLVDHDTGQQIGVIERAWIGNDAKGRALARFGTSPRAEQELQDSAAGIRVNVSVGYQIDELTLVELDGDPDNDGDVEPTYRAKWTPLEISNVAIPADMTVGVGRSASETEGREVRVNRRSKQEQRSNMEQTTTQTAPAPVPLVTPPPAPVVDVAGAAAAARTGERARIADITALATRHNLGPLGQEHIDKGTSIEAFRGVVLERIPAGKPLDTPASEIGLTPKEARQFSFLRAMAAQLPNAARDIGGLEREASAAIAKRVGNDPKGIFVPMEAMRAPMIGHNGGPALVDVQGRSLSVGTPAAGGYAVATDLLAQDFITLLRNAMMVRAMGATVLSGLVGNVAIPKQTGAASVTWQPEAANPAESDQALGQVTLSPKQAMGYTDYSRLLLQQSSISVENFVRADLAAIMGLAIDLAGLHGPGTGNAPTGIAATAGIGSVAGGVNGGAPTWPNIVGLETAVAAANADVGATGYLTNAVTRGKLKVTDKTTGGFGQFIWPDVAGPAAGFGLLNGYKAGVSNQVSSSLTKGTSAGVCSAIFFGNWSDLIIGEWGVLDLLVNPYTNAVAGAVRIHVYQTVDIGVRRAASFSAMLDALTA